MATRTYDEMTEAERAEIDRQEDEREAREASFAGADESSYFTCDCDAYNAEYEAALTADMRVLDGGPLDEELEAACRLHDELEDGMAEREDATTLKGFWS